MERFSDWCREGNDALERHVAGPFPRLAHYDSEEPPAGDADDAGEGSTQALKLRRLLQEAAREHEARATEAPERWDSLF